MIVKLLAATALLILPASAPSQLASGYSGQAGVTYGTEDDYWWALQQLGSCLAMAKRRDSTSLLSAPVHSRDATAAFKRLVGKETSCLRWFTAMRVAEVDLRGSIAEALYEAQLTSVPSPAPVPEQAALPLGEARKMGSYGIIRSFASCFAAAYPDKVHGLLATTKLGSRKEKEMLGGFSEEIGSCLPRNIQFDVPPAQLRLALAEAIYERSRGALSAQVSP
ncbi:MAG TPA: hypothetical protein VGR19_12130 [Allosphingosinicella sp.]|nr:hypothetical protein [Allosphingosinicella sp.]